MDYVNLQNCIKYFEKLKVNTIGSSEDDRNIYSLTAFFGVDRPWIIIQGAIHAREHLSSDLVVYLAECVEVNFKTYKRNKKFPNICFVPMLNPDGVEIAIYGTKNIKNVHKKSKCEKIINNCDPFLYKSNVNGVDLNNNFDARWGMIKNSSEPSMNGFIGPYPFSEKETCALMELTLKINPIFTISYHMKGEEIYWDFFQKRNFRSRDFKIAKMVSKVIGYKVKSTQMISSGGYKDWCVSKLQIPSLTIELGRDCFTHPVPSYEIYNIIAKNSRILDILCDIVKIINPLGDKSC